MEEDTLDQFDLQVMIVSGIKDVEKALAGLAMALAAASSGAKVVVFLTMEGAAFANPEEAPFEYVHGFESIQKYFTLLLEENVRIEACTTCVENFCLTERVNNIKNIHSGMHYAGFSTAAIRALTIKTLVF